MEEYLVLFFVHKPSNNYFFWITNWKFSNLRKTVFSISFEYECFKWMRIPKMAIVLILYCRHLLFLCFFFPIVVIGCILFRLRLLRFCSVVLRMFARSVDPVRGPFNSLKFQECFYWLLNILAILQRISHQLITISVPLLIVTSF